MFKKSINSLFFTALLATPLFSHATQYPLTITDMAGNTVTLQQEPKHVVLQDGRDIMALALLDRDDPFQRLVAWNNLPKKQDTATWNLLKGKWPDAENILDMGFGDKGDIELESVLVKKPDLMVAQLRAKASLEGNGVVNKLNELHIPLLFVDYEIDPAKNTADSIDLLGKVLNREENAKAYTDFYRQHAADIQQKTAAITPKPRVFIEPIAGNSDACCFSHKDNGWGGLLRAVGVTNIAADLLPGATGFISLEKVIAEKPDAYIMTGSKRGNSANKILPFGYNATAEDIQAKADVLLSRPGIDQVPAIKAGQVYGVYHHFYNHPYNIVGMEYLAKIAYPQALATLNPDQTYHDIVRRFTTLPDTPFIFSQKLAK